MPTKEMGVVWDKNNMGVVSQEVEIEATVTSLELSLAAADNPAPELTQAVKLSIHPPPFPA